MHALTCRDQWRGLKGRPTLSDQPPHARSHLGDMLEPCELSRLSDHLRAIGCYDTHVTPSGARELAAPQRVRPIPLAVCTAGLDAAVPRVERCGYEMVPAK